MPHKQIKIGDVLFFPVGNRRCVVLSTDFETNSCDAIELVSDILSDDYCSFLGRILKIRNSELESAIIIVACAGLASAGNLLDLFNIVGSRENPYAA